MEESEREYGRRQKRDYDWSGELVREVRGIGEGIEGRMSGGVSVR